MAQNKKIYVLDCGGRATSSRVDWRHEALSVIVPRAAASRSKRRLLDGVEETVHTTSTPSTPQLTGRAHAGATCPSPN